MTLIIGIICKDSIVIASDSQTTRDKTKRVDANKIETITFSEDRMILAHSGNMGNSLRAIELLRAMAKDQPIDDYRVPADCARRAMMQLKRELREQSGTNSDAEFEDWFTRREMQSEFILGYYFRGAPYLFTIDLDVSRADREPSWHSARGWGADLGGYLLKEYTKPDMIGSVACISAAYIIETTCRHVDYCDLPAKVAVVINNLSEWSQSESSITPQLHPSTIGKGAIIIYTANQVRTWASKIERIMTAEKKNRESKFERLLTREKSKNHKFIESFMQKPTPKGVDKLRKLLAGLSKLDTIKSQ